MDKGGNPQQGVDLGGADSFNYEFHTFLVQHVPMDRGWPPI